MRITEQDIRRLSIGRLRLFYKLRPRRDWNGIEIIDKAHYFKNITVDARLTYVEPDGKRFIATVEATSLDKRAEVDFRYNYFRWTVESLTLTLLCLAIIMGITEYLDFNVLHNEYIGGFWSWLLLSALLLWSSFAFLLSLNNRRYRYIYAVEQFKQFFANDQWIAISHDIYPNHDTRRWRELHRQCIQYGFGMMQVEKDHSVRVLITPKRGDFFEGTRSKMPEWMRKASSKPVLGKLLPAKTKPAPQVELEHDPITLDPLGNLQLPDPELLPAPVTASPPKPAKKGKPSFKTAPLQATKKWWWHLRWLLRAALRPKVVKRLPGYFEVSRKWWLPGILSVFFVLGILYHQAQDSPLADLNDKTSAWPLDELEEPNFRYRPPLDTAYENELNDFYNQRPERSTAPYTLDDELTTVPDVEDDSDLFGSDSDVYFYRITDADTTILFNCLRLPGGEEQIYVLEIARSPNFETALETAFNLHRNGGLAVNISRGDCLRTGSPDYVIFLDEPTADEGRINFLFRQHRNRYGRDARILEL